MNHSLMNKLTGVKRKHLSSEENQVENKKLATMMEETKRANFSALANTNGVAKTTLIKPATGNVKKLVIKNLKEIPKLPENYQVTTKIL